MELAGIGAGNIANNGMSLDQLPVNVFDLILIAMLVLGVVRGRKHGMSIELLLTVKWVIILGIVSFLYEPVGRFLSDVASLSLLASLLIAYLGLLGILFGFFALVSRALGGKLLGSDVFGRAEYYLGMGSGVVRYACILLAVLAVLNARYYSPKQVSAMKAFQQDVYGSDFFPTLHSAQSTVFEKSLTGPWIKQNLSFLLIKPTQFETRDMHQREANMLY